MVLGPVSCPAKIHFIAIFALKNGQFSRLGRGFPPHTPLSSIPEDKTINKDKCCKKIIANDVMEHVYIPRNISIRSKFMINRYSLVPNRRVVGIVGGEVGKIPKT